MTDAASPAAATPAKKARKPKDATKKKAAKPSHPPTSEMVQQAISVEQDPKGVSVMAIKKYITENYKVSPSMLKHMLRRAFEAGIADGSLTRPKGQADSPLLAGRYRLAPSKPAKKPAGAKPRKARTPVKKPAAAKKPKTPKKAVKKSPAKKPAAAKKSPKKAAKKSPKKPAAKKSPKKKAAKKPAKK